MPNTLTYLVAYGSNLDPLLMAERVGPYVVVGVGTAPGYRLAFAGHSRRWNGPVATLVKARGKRAPVVVYAIDSRQLAAMDVNEGVGVGVYRREIMRVEVPALGAVDAQVYLHNSDEAGPPPAAYVEVIRRGYRAFNLDETPLVAAVRAAR